MHAADFDIPAVRALERACARAWPAATTTDVHGWQWRCSGGGSRRANSVLPLDFDGPDLEATIADIEARYRACGLRSYFQVGTAAAPADLDARLASRGYAKEEPCLLLGRSLGPSPGPADVDHQPQPSDDWMAIYAEQQDPVRRAAAPGVLARVPATRAYFLVRSSGIPVATALAVLSPDGIAVVECVATRSDRRREGAAHKAMLALEAWAFGQGATQAVLQVVEGNAAARRLYARLGYREVGRYHYRWRQP